MRRKLIIIFGLCLIGLAMIGGTSAFLVANGHTAEMVATEGVDVKVTEMVHEGGEPRPFENIEGAMPGDKFSKVTEVWGVGRDAAWVRAKLKETGVKADGTAATTENALIVDIDRVHWLDPGDGYYYYNAMLEQGQKTHPLMTMVAVRDDLGDEHQGAKFNMELVVEVVQAAQNGNSVLEARGWPGTPEEGEWPSVVVPNTGAAWVNQGGAVVIITGGAMVLAVAAVMVKRYVLVENVKTSGKISGKKGGTIKKRATVKKVRRK